ncbi:SDR family NAD(P)-dependent oxidoreductase [Yeguia hominis]|uniref:SDR family NAD(P)-dependent oxidoreductase n=1 Tax=Yeguia hominis TaxID=2763662 RepID=A0A926D708_9FIRM|nr:SDR family NAD(P)-dependent oxidoreductase [Yeguia hominis]MBC8532573.1 SDR family NAD(P)-dependent oxidoreductase [Yeguia hominis]
MKDILVTGCARGLGLALAEQYLEAGYRVFGAIRSAITPELEALKKCYGDQLQLVQMDIGCTESVKKGCAEIKKKSNALELIINNAGVWPADYKLPLEEIDVDGFLDTININALGSLRIAKELIPLLRKGDEKAYVNISSGAASFMETRTATFRADEYPYAYNMSKTALNMGACLMQRYFINAGYKIKVLCICPGGVQTRMQDGCPQPPKGMGQVQPPALSAQRIRMVIEKHKDDLEAPFFWHNTGEAFYY